MRYHLKHRGDHNYSFVIHEMGISIKLDGICINYIFTYIYIYTHACVCCSVEKKQPHTTMWINLGVDDNNPSLHQLYHRWNLHSHYHKLIGSLWEKKQILQPLFLQKLMSWQRMQKDISWFLTGHWSDRITAGIAALHASWVPFVEIREAPNR